MRTEESNPGETINVNGEVIKNNEVAIVFIELRACLAKNDQNEDVIWPYNTIRESFLVLSKEKYLLVKRNLIVRADLIESIKRLPDRKLELTLKPPFKESFEISKYKRKDICSFGAKHDVDWWDKNKKDFR